MENVSAFSVLRSSFSVLGVARPWQEFSVTLVVYSVVSAAVLVFIGVSVARAIRFARSPLHLRWELYPVPHEAPERVEHGGSYLEQSEWWRQPRRKHLAGEVRFMVPEMLFLRALWTFNRPLWYRSFPFHFGLYLLAGTCALLFSTAVVARLVPGVAVGAAIEIVRELAGVSGITGLVLAVTGAAGLLHRRLTDPALRVSTAPGDVFNLLFFIMALGLLGAGYAARPAGAPGAFALVSGLVSWNLDIQASPLLAAGIVATALLAAYIPMTHMAHFIAKYFTYHSVRWDDEPMMHSARRAAALAEYLAFRPTWAASHIRKPGDTPTWAEVVASNPSQEIRR
jgi:nitrate reductase gamma subunit